MRNISVLVTTMSFIFILNISCSRLNSESEKVKDVYIQDTTFKIVGYLNGNSFKRLDKVDLSKLTYLNLAFANPDSAGNLFFRNNLDIAPIVKKAHEQNVKVFVSLAGGGTVNPEIWTRVLHYNKREKFIGSILNFVEKNNLDGVDVDIEWNLLPYLDSLYTAFVLDLQPELHARGKGLTTALAAVNLDPAVTAESLQAYDFINVMVYDKYLDSIGSHSPFSYIEEAYRYWTEERKIEPEKLVLGMPFYGYDFQAKKHTLYRNVVGRDTNNAYRDQIGTLYYNGIPTIEKKTKFALENANGVMFWEVTQDTTGEFSLLKTARDIINK